MTAAMLRTEAVPRRGTSRAVAIDFAGRAMLLDCAGGVFDIASNTLVVADLHLEKASAFARRGQMLPPYETLETLRRLEALTAHYQPDRLILLGDSFHRADSEIAAGGEEFRMIAALASRAALLWISGNHDPAPPANLPGDRASGTMLGAVMLRHEPGGAARSEIAGHLHPAARVATRAGMRRRRCFVVSQERILLPAFGALAGGLDIREAAIARLFPSDAATLYLLGEAALHRIPMRAAMA